MFKVWLEMSMLAFEAQQAIWLRSMKIATGGRAANREARLMVTEKVSAAHRSFLTQRDGVWSHCFVECLIR